LSVITICLAKLYVYRRRWANETLFCCIGHFTCRPSIFYCCRRHKFAKKALLCSTDM